MAGERFAPVNEYDILQAGAKTIVEINMEITTRLYFIFLTIDIIFFNFPVQRPLRNSKFLCSIFSFTLVFFERFYN